MLRFILLFWGIGLYAAANAHQLRPAIVDINFSASGGFELRIQTNLEARMAQVSPQHADTDDSPQAREYDRLRALPVAQVIAEALAYEPVFRRGLSLGFSPGEAAPLQLLDLQIPEVEDRRLPRLATLSYRGITPVDAESATWTYAGDFGDSVVRFSLPGSAERVSHWLKAGKSSPPLTLDGDVRSRTAVQTAFEYLVLGYEHILPKGLDHILFVLGLFLLSMRWRPLLWQVTAFTLAHTITLALTILGYISLPTTLVEPLIALSIAYVGIENMLTRTLHAWRPAIVFVFGLLHGMGFASVLTDLGLPAGQLANALISFNVGVELGQLSVILAAFLVLLPLRGNDRVYRRWVALPGSLLIALVGLYWTWERTLG